MKSFIIPIYLLLLILNGSVLCAHALINYPDLVEVPPSIENLPMMNLFDIVNEWNPDIPDMPDSFTEGLQHFNFGCPRERKIAEDYRNAELPFKLYNISELDDTISKWTDDYLYKQTKSGGYHVEKSVNNHFMWWSMGMKKPKNFVPPTEVVHNMDFKKWLSIANEADSSRMENSSEHFYFMASAQAHERGRTFISRDLPFFSNEEPNFFISVPENNKGIQCRFAMRGVISEAHYDSGRNMVAMLRGKKRYILSPPSACENLAIISDRKHPSYRHSIVDWSDPAQASSAGFKSVKGFDTVVRKGELLYIPSYWFQ